MYKFPIGVMLNSFRTTIPDAIERAAALKLKGVQLHMARGEYAPENMTPARRRELLDMVRSNGMVISAVCGEQSLGFVHKDKNPELVERAKRILDMARDLDCTIVTTHIGVIPQDKTSERYNVMQEACYTLAEYADSVNAHFAIETGPEPAATLRGFLDDLGSTGVSVNLDPANLVMVTGDDPVKAVHNLKDYIVHTHAKDGVMLAKGNPEYIYGVVHPVPVEFQGIRYFEEVPLGTGQVDYPAYLAALDEIGYRGYLTIEREVGNSPEKDITTAANFLREIINK